MKQIPALISHENASTYADIIIQIQDANNDYSILQALHNRLHVVFFELREPFQNDWSALSSTIRICGAISNIRIVNAEIWIDGPANPTPHEFIQAVFPIQMRLLKKLSVFRLPRRDSIEHIANVTGKLKTLNLNCIFPLQPAALNRISSSNPLLSNILISESIPIEMENAVEEVTAKLCEELVTKTPSKRTGQLMYKSLPRI